MPKLRFLGGFLGHFWPFFGGKLPWPGAGAGKKNFRKIFGKIFFKKTLKNMSEPHKKCFKAKKNFVFFGQPGGGGLPPPPKGGQKVLFKGSKCHKSIRRTQKPWKRAYRKVKIDLSSQKICPNCVFLGFWAIFGPFLGKIALARGRGRQKKISKIFSKFFFPKKKHPKQYQNLKKSVFKQNFFSFFSKNCRPDPPPLLPGGGSWPPQKMAKKCFSRVLNHKSS